MPSENTEQRKLAAIMFTDMVGYSSLAQRCEASLWSAASDGDLAFGGADRGLTSLVSESESGVEPPPSRIVQA